MATHIINEQQQQPAIVIGDIHGLTAWKTAVSSNPACRYIFLGDYLDPYQPIPTQILLQNLREIIQLKQQRPAETVLLLGNHDLHYFAAEITASSRFNPGVARRAGTFFLENIQLFAYAFQQNDQIFTHAGISRRWFDEDFKGDVHKNIAAQLNAPSDEQIAAICRCGEARGGAPGTVGGIFWADRSELLDPLPGFRQYAGHNRVENTLVHSRNGGEITFCDCLRFGKYLRLA